jgi:hypothetical protein
MTKIIPKIVMGVVNIPKLMAEEGKRDRFERNIEELYRQLLQIRRELRSLRHRQVASTNVRNITGFISSIGQLYDEGLGYMPPEQGRNMRQLEIYIEQIYLSWMNLTRNSVDERMSELSRKKVEELDDQIVECCIAIERIFFNANLDAAMLQKTRSRF